MKVKHAYEAPEPNDAIKTLAEAFDAYWAAVGDLKDAQERVGQAMANLTTVARGVGEAFVMPNMAMIRKVLRHHNL